MPLHISEALQHLREGLEPQELRFAVQEQDLFFAQTRLVFAARQMQGRHDFQWPDFVYPLPATRTTVI